MLGLIPCINRQNFLFLKIVRIRPEILTLSRRLIFITIGGTHVLIVFSRERTPDLWRYYIYFHISGNPFVTIDYLFFIFNFLLWSVSNWAGGRPPFIYSYFDGKGSDDRVKAAHGFRLLFLYFKVLKIFFSYYSKKSKKGGCFFLCKLLSLALSPWGVVLGVLSLILLKSFSTGIPSFIKVLSFFGSSFLQSLSHSPFLSFLTRIVSRGRGRERMG